eukprot:COSAG02_NODE_27936_length_599_cov_14602.030000_1_plen_23_part_10
MDLWDWLGMQVEGESSLNCENNA